MTPAASTRNIESPIQSPHIGSPSSLNCSGTKLTLGHQSRNSVFPWRKHSLRMNTVVLSSWRLADGQTIARSRVHLYKKSSPSASGPNLFHNRRHQSDTHHVQIPSNALPHNQKQALIGVFIIVSRFSTKSNTTSTSSPCTKVLYTVPI